MNAKLFLVSFIVLNLFAISTIVYARSYDIDIEEDMDIIWICNVCNEDEMEDIWQIEDERDAPDWDDYGFWEDIEANAKMRWLITDIDEKSDYNFGWDTNSKDVDALRVKYDFWGWTDDDDWGEEDERNVKFYAFEDPEDYGENVELLMPLDPRKPDGDTQTTWLKIQTRCSTFYIDDALTNYYIDEEDDPTIHYYNFGVPLWLPSDTDEYLDEIDFKRNYDVEDLKLSAEIDEGNFNIENNNEEFYELPNEDIQYEATYNENGLLNNFKLFNKDNELICEFSLQMFNFIPGYDLPILLGITGLSILSVIYIIIRRK